MSWFNYFDSSATPPTTWPTYSNSIAQQAGPGVLGNVVFGTSTATSPLWAQGVQALGQQGLANYSNTVTAPYNPSWTQLTEDDLANEAFNTPIETLVNLWLARFGDAWIDKTNVVGDKFFEIAAQRLIRLSRMEEYSIIAKNTPSYKMVLRVIS